MSILLKNCIYLSTLNNEYKKKTQHTCYNHSKILKSSKDQLKLIAASYRNGLLFF